MVGSERNCRTNSYQYIRDNKTGMLPTCDHQPFLAVARQQYLAAPPLHQFLKQSSIRKLILDDQNFFLLNFQFLHAGPSRQLSEFRPGLQAGRHLLTFPQPPDCFIVPRFFSAMNKSLNRSVLPHVSTNSSRPKI